MSLAAKAEGAVAFLVVFLLVLGRLLASVAGIFDSIVPPPTVIPIGRLPVLTAENRDAYPTWHAYIRRVYGSDVLEPLDLNSFTWFYNFSPLGDAVPTLRVNPIDYVGLDMPWTGRFPLFPESKFARAGFFVRRPVAYDFATRPRIEVLRVSFPEEGAAWFYHTIGSGVFLETSSLQPSLVIGNRRDWRGGWPGDGAIASEMRKRGLKMIVLVDSLDAQARNPRTEIIVAAEGDLHTACVLQEALSSGLSERQRRPCHCDPSIGPFLNCGRVEEAKGS